MTTSHAYFFDGMVSPALRKATAQVLDRWELVADLSFSEVLEASGADLIIHLSDEYGPGAAYIGGPDIWIDPGLERTAGWDVGSYGNLVISHEIGGHAVTRLYDIRDGSADMTETLMSYTWPISRAGEYMYPEGPMPLDVWSAIATFGASTRTDGDTVWRIGQADTLQTIYDHEGTDILDLSALTDGCIIDLGPLWDGAGWVDTYAGVIRTIGIEGVRLGAGADIVETDGLELILEVRRNDTVLVDDVGAAEKLSKREIRAAGLGGKGWYELDAGVNDDEGSTLMQLADKARWLKEILVDG